MTTIEFGRSIREARKERGYSQEKLARVMETSRETVRAIEAGENWPSVPTLVKLGSALKLDPVELLRPVFTAVSPSATIEQDLGR